MAWLAKNAGTHGYEVVFDYKPLREYDKYCPGYWSSTRSGCVTLPKGTIKRLIGRELTWDDEPVEFTEVVG